MVLYSNPRNFPLYKTWVTIIANSHPFELRYRIITFSFAVKMLCNRLPLKELENKIIIMQINRINVIELISLYLPLLGFCLDSGFCHMSSVLGESCINQGNCRHSMQSCHQLTFNSVPGLLFSQHGLGNPPVLNMKHNQSSVLLKTTHFIRWSDDIISVKIGDSVINNPNQGYHMINFTVSYVCRLCNALWTSNWVGSCAARDGSTC
eukprot:sb/3470380/